jgi:NADH:ubiquinone oxidoreductase subunit F (NADH-binding)/(2Fe-2S) ferredoxin/NAD-dependent dihydropyrimidine dehydrogenase PreA subunit
MRYQSVDEFRAHVTKLKGSDQARQRRLLCCCGTGCLASGAAAVAEATQKALAALPTDKQAKLNLVMKKTGCHGFCEKGPLLVLMPEARGAPADSLRGGGRPSGPSQTIFYKNVKPKDVPEVIEKTVLGGRVIERLLYRDPKTDKPVTHYGEIDFYAKQTRVAMRNIGLIDPANLDDYLLRDGYQALGKVLSAMTPEQVLATVEKAKLRGRGGGGFDAGRKWRSCKSSKVSDVRYVICNGDEGDPGAFMDRSIMEGDPHGVIEGMIIGAYALECHEGYVYVRQEYPLAVEHLQHAINDARERGLLGEKILGSDFSFDLTIARGGGAFVCGESSALMRSVEGKVGEPRAKYVHATDRGLWDKPTVLNNVETWVTVPRIIEKGADWFCSIGTERSKGTKAFALTGKVKNTGLVEVEMGTTMRNIIFGPGGGMLAEGERGRFKAVQTGGPSGGCLPESHLDLPVDFDSLTKAGSMMGSGGMIVMDHSTCMVDVARYFLSFLTDESCGKCVPCREGLWQMYRIVSRICEGKGTEPDLVKIEDLSQAIELGSLCALGKSGPTPVLSTLRYFKDEYLAHIQHHRCPAGVCKALITYRIDGANCDGCGACLSACAQSFITGTPKKGESFKIDELRCDRCGACAAVCKRGAILVA